MVDTTRAQSRIIKQQRNTMVKQTALGFVIGAVVLVAFIFFILPNSAQLLTFMSDSGLPTNQDTIAPQTPVFNAPVTDTNASELELSGFAEVASKVQVEVNGVQLEEVIAGEDGTFAQTINLSEGENIVTAVSVDEAGNISQPSRAYVIVLDTTTPELLLEGVEPEMTREGRDQKIFRLVGKTKPESKVTINDRFLFARADGSFQYDISLSDGENPITVAVTDKAGNTATSEFLIRYRQ